MVIYWHGYLSHLEQEDMEVLLTDRFPPGEAITMLAQLDVAGVLASTEQQGVTSNDAS